MEIIYYLIGLPIISGLLCFLLPDRVRILIWGIAFDICFVLFGVILFLFIKKPVLPEGMFIWDSLTNLTLLGIGFFGLVVCVYSYKIINELFSKYYGCLLITIGAAAGVVLSNNLILMSVFWGILAITLYLMINLGGPEAAYPAKKTLIMVGGSDSFLILGIAIIWVLTGSFNITEIKVEIDRYLSACAFLCFVGASFAKAGAMPFHTWIPEISEKAPVSVMAFLPASLDKILGIYLLARVCLNLFSYHETMWFLLNLLGAVTIVGAVFLALVQHNMKKLLAYHAVSQVGYMVIGIASANPVGIAGGLFHMINHAIYKCCLFLGAGSVEKQTGTTDLEDLGGLGKRLPLTFICFLFASFAISGIPPFNGFFSKWMIYQGLVGSGKASDQSWVLWIVMAMIGSGLTLASFLKIIHATFLGSSSENMKSRNIKESHVMTLIPLISLAALCLVFGIFFVRIPLIKLISPIVPEINLAAIFSLSLPLYLLLSGFVLGLLMYGVIFFPKKRKIVAPFIGGEKQSCEMKISGTDFYNQIKKSAFLNKMYCYSEKKFTDIYELLKSTADYFIKGFMVMHTGILGTYLTWVVFGILIFLYIYIRW